MIAPGSTAERLRDGAQVGSLFGIAAGGFVLVVMLGWNLVSRLWGDPPSFSKQLLAHGAAIAIYAGCGALVGMLWTWRVARTGRVVLWALMTGAGIVSLVSLRSGAFWTWPGNLWGRVLLTATAFGLVFGWPSRRSGAKSPPGDQGSANATT